MQKRQIVFLAFLAWLVAGLVLLSDGSAFAESRVLQTPMVGGAGGGTPTLQKELQLQKDLQLKDPLLALRPIVTLAPAARELRIKELMKSVEAIEDKGGELSEKIRRAVADAALNAEEKTGVDAVSMIALARMESDFRGLIMINTHCKYGLRIVGCYADCGMTQHHVRGDLFYVRKECKKLSKDHRYSFLKSAEEIARHIQWCKEHAHQSWHRPLRRCVLNRYNMGPAYRRLEQCDKDNRCGYINRASFSTEQNYLSHYKDCTARRRKCRVRAAYWKKMTCFEYGARNALKARKSCRWCYNLPLIPTFFYGSQQQTDKTVFNALLLKR